jgi:putative ABC transport system permease protein
MLVIINRIKKMIMLYYNLKLAFRNWWRNITFSIINTLGLTIGLASCIIIGLYAYSELSFDRFHSGIDHIYRINKITNEKGKQAQKDALTPGQLAPALEKTLPGVIAASRFRPWFSDMLVSYDSVRLQLKNVSYADASFLQIFDFNLIKGNRQTALAEPFTAVVTETTAHKYFGNSDPIGKTLTTLNDMQVTVTGVVKDVPSNSSIDFPMLISWSTLTAKANADNFSWMNSWSAQVSFTFVQLKENINATETGNKISNLLHLNFPEEEFEYKTYLQPLKDIHLNSGDIVYSDQFVYGSAAIVNTILIIAAFILLIASFNFINLSTAGAFNRVKETGVQKVLGATPVQIGRKFFGESFLLCAISMLAAVLLVAFLLPFFNELSYTNLKIDLLLKPQAAVALFMLLVLISVIAGLYPAIFLSRFKSTDIFRKTIHAGKGNTLRKMLVTTQFALSVVLIIATIVVNSQVQFFAIKDLGFNKEQIVVLPLANTSIQNKAGDFITALKQYPGILAATATNSIAGEGFNGYGIIPEGHSANEHLLSNVLETDADFASAYKIQLTRGRFFSPEMPSDTSESIVINEAMAQYLNWKDPIGKQLEIYETQKGKVIGVTKDFNFTSLHEKVQPLAIILRNNPQYISLKLKAGTTKASLAFIEHQWKQFETQYPFHYTFIDEQLNKFYQSDMQLLHVLNIFAGLAIFIACIGLFGLSIYTASVRTKEIGIRKVLGASVSQVTVLLSKEFITLVCIAILIGSPVAWIAANKWLQSFAFRINISWWMFALAGALAIFVALLTISFQAIRTALTNSVKSLRSE